MSSEQRPSAINEPSTPAVILSIWTRLLDSDATFPAAATGGTGYKKTFLLIMYKEANASKLKQTCVFLDPLCSLHKNDKIKYTLLQIL